MIQWKLKIRGQGMVVLTDDEFNSLPRNLFGQPDLGEGSSGKMIHLEGLGGFSTRDVINYVYERIDTPLSNLHTPQEVKLNHDGIYRLMLLHALHDESRYQRLSEEDKFAAELLRAELPTPSSEEKQLKRQFRAMSFDIHFPTHEAEDKAFHEWKTRYESLRSVSDGLPEVFGLPHAAQPASPAVS